MLGARAKVKMEPRFREDDVKGMRRNGVFARENGSSGFPHTV
jgi:hypothetical protein